MSLNKMTVEPIMEYVDPNDRDEVIETNEVFINRYLEVQRTILEQLITRERKELAKKEAELADYEMQEANKNMKGVQEDTKNARVKQNNAGPPENEIQTNDSTKK